MSSRSRRSWGINWPQLSWRLVNTSATVLLIELVVQLRTSARYASSIVEIFFAQELTPLLSPLGTDVLSRCMRSECWNSRGRLCLTVWRADLSESGRQREWVRWARIAHQWVLGKYGHVLLLWDWSRRTWSLPWYHFEDCGAFRRWVCHGWEWG